MEDGKNGIDPENLFAVTLAKGGEESFPVLKAFQSFLDQERERARRRMFTLSMCFISAIVVLVALFAVGFAVFFGRVVAENKDQQTRLLDYVLNGNARAPAEPAASPALTLDDVKALLEEMRAERGETRPAAPETRPGPAAPETQPVPAERHAPARPANGIYSTPLKSEREAAFKAEEAARKLRLQGPVGPNGAMGPAPKPAPAVEPAAPKPAPAPAPAARSAAPAAVKPAPGGADSGAPITIKAGRPGVSKTPDGATPDVLRVKTPSGATVHLRSLLPTENPAQ